MFALILLNIAAGTDTSSKSGISTGALVGIILGSIACVISLSAIFILLILRTRLRRHDAVSKPHHCEFLLTMNQILSLASNEAPVMIKNLEVINYVLICLLLN